tara:strand:+ start:782 stop:1177 length:396 start_codon:yes stop_codon:yes gene_type:complete
MAKTLLRTPYSSELDYFKENLDVTGMATEDNKIILNPYSTLSDNEKQKVIENETARIIMRKDKNMIPKFSLTEEQEKFLDSTMAYKDASPEDRSSTIAARIFSGDPSAGRATEEQIQFVDNLRKKVWETNN